LSGNRGDIGVLPRKIRDVYGMACMVVPYGSGGGRIGGWDGCGGIWRVARGVKPRGVARNRPRLRGGEVSPGRGPGARFAGFLSDFASLRLMTRIEFDLRVCWPRFHHVADATRSPDGRHVRASPRANVPLVRRMCLVLPVPATCYFPRLGSPPPLTSRATDIFRKTIATPPPWRCFVGLAERIFAVVLVHVFHFLRGCPDLGGGKGVAGIGERQCHFSREKLRSDRRVQENEKLVVTFRAPFAMRGVYALAVFLSRRPGVVVGSVSRAWAALGVASIGNSVNLSAGFLNGFCPQDIERRFPGSPPAGSAPTGSRRGAFCSPQVTRRINPRGPLFRCSLAS